jgi:hypothetical protein
MSLGWNVLGWTVTRTNLHIKVPILAGYVHTVARQHKQDKPGSIVSLCIPGMQTADPLDGKQTVDPLDQ